MSVTKIDAKMTIKKDKTPESSKESQLRCLPVFKDNFNYPSVQNA